MAEEVEKQLRIEGTGITERRFQSLAGQGAHCTDAPAFGGRLLATDPLPSRAAPVVQGEVQAGTRFSKEYELAGTNPGQLRLISSGQLLDALSVAPTLDRCFFYNGCASAAA